MQNRPTAHGARARALRSADLVVVRDNSRRAPPRLVGHGSTARPSHQVGGCGFEPSIILRSTFLARSMHAHRPVENRPTTHGTRARALRNLDLVVVRDNSQRAPPQPHGRGLTARPPHQLGGCGFALSTITRSIPAARGQRAHLPVKKQLTAHGTSARALRGADLVVVWDNWRHDPSQFVGRCAAPRPPH